MKFTWNFISFFALSLVGIGVGQFYYRRQDDHRYTTNIYQRQPFQCYVCTNNYDASNTRMRYDQATHGCGFAEDFNPNDPNVRKQLCYTYCLKKEVGIAGSRIDVERRCDPTCQEYDGNTKANYLIDRVSCCVGNYCNHDIRLTPSSMSVTLFSLITFLLIAFN